jgi:SAM-dependent methyltransferase/uncharacterized protein YbaR (Trm112 family)
MYLRLLDFLRCPQCGGTLEMMSLSARPTSSADEITEGLLYCGHGDCFPIVRGIPRMLPDSLDEHWPALEAHIPSPPPEVLRPILETRARSSRRTDYDDRRTRANFSEEWRFHDFGGGRTWGIELEARLKDGFVKPLRIPEESLRGKVVLDAGCGNGSQSVAYTRLGLEVIAIDLSTGVEHGQAFRWIYPGADPSKVHFVQADLQRPPLASESVDVIHSAGVLHHTPNTLTTFRALRPLLKPGGTFYVMLYKHEPVVTPLVNTIRAVTTRIPSYAFARIARLMALPFIAFCRTVDALGIRAYPSLSHREAALALMDIFGAPYAHYHSYDEVEGWYRAEDFREVWGVNESRRGFGACGRLAAEQPRLAKAIATRKTQRRAIQ